MKRLIGTILWFTVGWVVGSAGALVLGVGPALGPVLAVAMAGLVFIDPRRIIWTQAISSDALRRQNA